jgi:hypothetical protein
MNLSTFRRPSAWSPIAMSLAALGLVLSHIARFGVTRQADEGASAHLWQLLMALQLPVIAYFGIRWLPRTPWQGAVILSLQFAAGLAAALPVFLLRW